MARSRKPSGGVNKGPFDAAAIAAGLKRLGGVETPGGNHQKVYVHPERGWRIPVSDNWTSIRKGDPIFNGMVRTTGVDAKKLLAAINDEL